MKIFSFKTRKGSTLLVVLAGVTLVTILAVYLLLMMRCERGASNLSLSHMQADALADFASATAIERLREAIDEGRVPPDANRDYYTTWASEPGRIYIYKISQTDGAITQTTRDMFSAPPGTDASSGNVDLNEASYSGIHAITGTAPGTMKIGWTPVLTNPDQPASRINPVMGRIAYWVDDDSCKVDINTPDGSAKNDPIATQVANNHFSYGFGTPSEISLQAFPEISALAPTPATGKTVAAAIAEYAASTGFNSVAEIKRVTDVPANFYTAHQFDLTPRSLTPELTMTGEPRTYLTFARPLVGTPTLGVWRAAATGPYGNYGAWKLFTFWNASDDANAASVSGPLDFYYPNPNQLPGDPSVTGSPIMFPQSNTGGYGNMIAVATAYPITSRCPI